MSIRSCLEVCCSPNTVSKFIRLFPKAALLFLLLHIGLMLMTVIGYGKKDHLVTTTVGVMPQEPVDDLGAIRVKKPVNWEIPRVMSHKNKTESKRKKRKKKRPSVPESQPFKLLDD